MILDKEGNPLAETKDRRNEVQRCIDIVGWSWSKLADRLGIKFATSLAIKNCKRPIADSDLRWLQELADVMIAHPRPAEMNDPEPVAGAPIVQAGAMMMPAEDVAPVAAPVVQQVTAQNPPVDLLKEMREELAEQQAVAIVSGITSVYLSAVPGVGPDAMTSEQVAGARWALGELAQQLGVLDLVQDQLRHYQAKIATHEQQQRAGIIGAAERQPMA